MKVEMVSVDSLKHAEYNPRRLSTEDFEHIKKSIETFGFVENIVVNSAPDRAGIIIGGNQRFEVAKALGHKQVPVFYINIPDLKKEKELNIRLNRNMGNWDWDILANNYETPDLLEYGFKDYEISAEIDPDKFFEEDKKDSEVEKPKTMNCPHCGKEITLES